MSWRDFFYFSTGERRALALLLCLITIAGIFLIWGDTLYNRQQAEADAAAEAYPDAPSNNEATDRAAYATPPADSRPRQSARPPYRRPASQRSESMGERVRRLTDRRPHYPRREKLAPGQTIELNTADTTTLQKVPGIGPYYARRIVKFRALLGGFAHVEQLGEVYGIDAEKYAELAPWFTVDARRIHRMAINRLPEDSLRRHPYINYAQARVIVRQRRRNGPIGRWEDLALLEEFSTTDRGRLEPYLSFE